MKIIITDNMERSLSGSFKDVYNKLELEIKEEQFETIKEIALLNNLDLIIMRQK